jgi:hypothetical protein
VERGGYPARLQNTELVIIFLQGGRGNGYHGFAFSEDREHGTLSASMRKGILIDKLSSEGFDRPGASDFFFDAN